MLPETLNLLHCASDDTPLEAAALEDWQTATAPLLETAAHLKIALVLPLLVHPEGALANRFYLLSRDDERGRPTSA